MSLDFWFYVVRTRCPTENSSLQQLRHWHLKFSSPLGHRFLHQWPFGFCRLPCEPSPQSSRCLLVKLPQPGPPRIGFGCISLTLVTNFTQQHNQLCLIKILQMRPWRSPEYFGWFQSSWPVDAHVTQQPWHIESIWDIWCWDIHSNNINNSCADFFYHG